jgi:hypothetical protein
MFIVTTYPLGHLFSVCNEACLTSFALHSFAVTAPLPESFAEFFPHIKDLLPGDWAFNLIEEAFGPGKPLSKEAFNNLIKRIPIVGGPLARRTAVPAKAEKGRSRSRERSKQVSGSRGRSRRSSSRERRRSSSRDRRRSSSRDRKRSSSRDRRRSSSRGRSKRSRSREKKRSSSRDKERKRSSSRGRKRNEGKVVKTRKRSPSKEAIR